MQGTRNNRTVGERRPKSVTFGLIGLVIGLNLVLASCWAAWTDFSSWGWGSSPAAPQATSTPTPIPSQSSNRVPPPVVPTPYAIGQATPTPIPPGADTVEVKPPPPPTSTPVPTATPAPVITNADLERVLITAGDLSGSWSPSSMIDLDLSSQDSICNVPGPDTVVSPAARAQSQFQQTDFGPFVGMNVSAYTTRSDAQVVMSYLRQAISCDTWHDSSLDRDWNVSALSFPDRGDESFAIQLTTSLGFIGTARVQVVVIRTESVITVVAHGAIGSVDSGETERLVDLALQKLEALP